MKMQIKKMSLLLCFCVTTFVIGCNKSTSEVDAISEETKTVVESEDSEMIASESESVEDDASNTISSSARFCGSSNVFGSGSLPFDLDTSNPGGGARLITITYNGNVLGCRKRTGTITIELLNAARWVEPGAMLKIKYNNFKVENVCRNKSVTLNGEKFMTNVSGGNHFSLSRGLSTTLNHKVRTGSAGLTATFTDSLGTKSANWNIARKTTITHTSSPSKFNYEVSGDTTINSKANTSSWGQTRFARSYQTTINQSIKANTFCKLWKPISGSITHYQGTVSSTLLYGLNFSGNPVTGNDCAGFFKVTYTLPSGSSVSKLIAYR